MTPNTYWIIIFLSTHDPIYSLYLFILFIHNWLRGYSAKVLHLILLPQAVSILVHITTDILMMMQLNIYAM